MLRQSLPYYLVRVWIQLGFHYPLWKLDFGDYVFSVFIWRVYRLSRLNRVKWIYNYVPEFLNVYSDAQIILRVECTFWEIYNTVLRQYFLWPCSCLGQTRLPCCSVKTWLWGLHLLGTPLDGMSTLSPKQGDHMRVKPMQKKTSCNVLTNTGIHGSIKYGPARVLLFNRELRIADHYLRTLSQSYVNI